MRRPQAPRLSRILGTTTPLLLTALFAVSSCSSDEGKDSPLSTTSEGRTDNEAGATSTAGTPENTSGANANLPGGTGTDATSTGTLSEDSADTNTTGAGASTTQDDTAVKPTKLPSVTGTCPDFVEGDLEFNPAGLQKTRKVKLWISEKAKTLDGPILFYWHGANGSPTFAPRGLGPIIKNVTDLGGVVVAPYQDPDNGTFPWFLVSDPSGARLDDLILADEVLACAIQKIGIDTSRIHVVGMSAGGLQTAQMSYRRSNYVASSSPFSGGFVETEPTLQDSSNVPASMIFHGGESDVVILNFQETSERYLKNLKGAGGFGFICNHGNGHSGPIDDLPSVWQFLLDHPYKVSPFPYKDALPASFPQHCTFP